MSTGEVITLGTVAGTVSTFPYTLGGGSYTISSITDSTFSFDFAGGDEPETEITTTAVFLSTGMYTAVIEVFSTPDFPGIGRTFHIDKVLFRE